MSLELKIEGLKEIAASFREIPPTLRGSVLRSAVNKATTPMMQGMIRRAPYLRLTGKNAPTLQQLKDAVKNKTAKTMPGALQRSIRKQWLNDLPFPDYQVGCKIGPTVFYAGFYEFGTARQPARPFIAPAFDEQIEETIDTLKEAVGEQIDKTLRKYGWR